MSKSNNGWILCSERLPNEEGQYLVCDGKTKRAYIAEYINAYIEGEENDDSLKWVVEDFDTTTEEYLYIRVDVIAWQPLPQPYRAETN